MANVYLFNKAYKATVEYRKNEQRLQKDEKDAMVSYYSPLLSSLTEKILDGWENKVSKASERGFHSTNIFRYHSGEKWDGQQVGDKGSSIDFLIRGLRQRRTYWEDNGFTPVMDRVRKQLVPFQVTIQWYGERNGTVVELHWKTKQ